MKKKITILFMFVITLLLTISCGNNAGTGCKYDTFHFKSGDIRFTLGGDILEHPLFTFEYPAGFEPADLSVPLPKGMDIVCDGDTSVRFIRDERRDIWDSLGVKVYKQGTPLGSKDATEAISRMITRGHNQVTYGIFENFVIEQNEPYNFQGIPARYLIVSYHDLVSDKPDSQVRFRYIRSVLFDYEGFIWELYFAGYRDEDAETNVYFQHMLDTFKFLSPYPDGLEDR